jgi:hypothetical protein
MKGRMKLFAVLRTLWLPGVIYVAAGCATLFGVSDSRVVPWVDNRVAERQPPASDKRFDEIAWVPGIRHAIQLGTENDRPVFLYTGDGKINTGRC